MLSTIKNREAAVAQATANSAIEGYEPDANDLAMQQAFVAGEISTDDMLEQIRAEAIAAAAETPADAGADAGHDAGDAQ